MSELNAKTAKVFLLIAPFLLMLDPSAFGRDIRRTLFGVASIFSEKKLFQNSQVGNLSRNHIKWRKGKFAVKLHKVQLTLNEQIVRLKNLNFIVNLNLEKINVRFPGGLAPGKLQS